MCVILTMPIPTVSLTSTSKLTGDRFVGSNVTVYESGTAVSPVGVNRVSKVSTMVACGDLTGDRPNENRDLFPA